MFTKGAFLRNRELAWGLVFIGPALLYFLVFWIYPVLATAWRSLFRFRGGKPDAFVGLQNYADLLNDPLFLWSVAISLIISIGIVVVTFALALGLALLLNDPEIRGVRWFRIAIFAPVVTDWVATALIFQLIFLPNQGVLASFFASLGLKSLVGLNWLSSRQLGPVAIIIFSVWKTVGLFTVILFAGLKSVPRALIEAAIIDGSRPSQILRFVTLPMLMPLVVFVVIVAFVNAIGLFEPVFMLTGGGPADATKTLPLFLQEKYFVFSKQGPASAVGVLFLLLTLSFAVIAARQLRQTAYEE
jgi:ABC-type sugar transport system permease subunit